MRGEAKRRRRRFDGVAEMVSGWQLGAKGDTRGYPSPPLQRIHTANLGRPGLLWRRGPTPREKDFEKFKKKKGEEREKLELIEDARVVDRVL